jgi:hypothetical protein
MSTGRLATLKCYTDPREARLAVRRLKAAGIPSFLSGEASALTRGAAPSVKVEVAEELFEHARRVLESPAALETAIQTEPPDVEEEESPADAEQVGEGDSSEGDSLVTLEVFYDSREAEYAAEQLRAAGVPFGMKGMKHELIPGLNLGGPTLSIEVREGDFERACKALGYVVERETPDDPFAPGRPEEEEEAITADAPLGASSAEARRSPNIEAPLKMTPTPPPAGPEQKLEPAVDADRLAARINREAPRGDEPEGGRVGILPFLIVGVFLIWLALRLLGLLFQG